MTKTLEGSLGMQYGEFPNKTITAPQRAIQVNTNFDQILNERKDSIEDRLGPDQFPDNTNPQIGTVNTHYEVGERNQVISSGGIGAIHQMVQGLGLIENINNQLHVLKRHLPYHESDHVLNIAYNALLGGSRLEDIELRRRDESFLDALNAPRIPDPTTAGDFTRRFGEQDIKDLMGAINHTRTGLYTHLAKQNKQPKFMQRAYVDADGTIAGTTGESKEGMALSYKGIWGYAPLVISLANTKEVLFLVNRSGNKVSHDGWAPWADEAIELISPHAEKICLRGDTDFSTTVDFDRWDEQGIEFVFGMDAHPKLKGLAGAIAEEGWQKLERPPKYTITTKGRVRPENHKEKFIKAKEYKNLKLLSEDITEFEYRPTKCGKDYRMVVIRKNISVEKGELDLGDEIRYFFYITNRRDISAAEVVGLANRRCDQENVIEQLKNGVNAMRMPVGDLMSNWAYMVMAGLAWNLKAWFGLLVPDAKRSREIVTMEFRRFWQGVIMIPAQVVKTARKVVLRLMGYNSWMKTLLDTWEVLRGVRIA